MAHKSGAECSTCQAYYTTGGGTGECRIHAPVAVWNGDASSPAFLSGFPEVTDGGWCAMYRPGGPGEGP